MNKSGVNTNITMLTGSVLIVFCYALFICLYVNWFCLFCFVRFLFSFFSFYSFYSFLLFVFVFVFVLFLFFNSN